MVVRAIRLCASVVVGGIALTAWTYGLVVLICLGVGGLPDFPDMSGLPPLIQKNVAAWLISYLAMAGVLTGVWPATRVGRLVWRAVTTTLEKGRSSASCWRDLRRW